MAIGTLSDEEIAVGASLSQLALEVMRHEAEAILQLADSTPPDSLERAIQLLKACGGKVVVCGIGKSGLIGRKIAATLTSTGSPAVFLHPAEAFHGDLGILQTGDVGLLISHSGETAELLPLIAQFRTRSVSIIALVGNLRSTLGRAADVALSTAIDREACPLNLAPTASTAATLALGDALAMAVMQARGYTSEDFARNHPGGRLGKRLTLRVRDLMHAGADSPTVAPSAMWTDVIGALSRIALGAVNVVDENQRLLGLITDGDVRRTVQRTAPMELPTLTAERMMTSNPITVLPERLAIDALQIMENRPSQISVLPVVSDGNGICLGLLRLHDILRSGIL